MSTSSVWAPIARAACAFASTWLLLALLSQAWLSWRVPVLPSDLQDASWIVPYSRVMFPVRASSTMMGLGVCSVALAACVWRRQRNGAVLSLVMALAVLAAASPAHVLRMGVATGTARVGCYVYAMRECGQMLKIPVSDTLSRYADRRGVLHGDYATWYRLSFALLHPRAAHPSDLVTVLPGGYFLLGPIYAFEGEAIARALASQRLEVESLRRQHGQAQPAAAGVY